MSESFSYSPDDEVQWVYEVDEPNYASSAAGDAIIDFDRVALPRYFIYGQGVLLAAVAMVSLVLGILIGRSGAPQTTTNSGAPRPCYLTGRIAYSGSSGAAVPDSGAVVIVVPQDERLEQKAPVEGLRPGDPEPALDHPAVERLKSIGGDYTRTDAQGRFKLRVPDTGEYFLLVLSHGAKRRAGERLDPVQLAQIGRYFLSAPDLLAEHRYLWRSETIKRDKQYDLVLD